MMFFTHLKNAVNRALRDGINGTMSTNAPSLSQDTHTLEIARKNLIEFLRQNEPKLPEIGDRWGYILQGIREMAPRFSNTVEAIHFGQRDYAGFDHRLPAAQSTNLIELTLDLLIAEFPRYRDLIDSISESPFSRPETLVVHGSRSVSNILLFDLRYVLLCINYLQPVNSVCEIGGGNGMPAYTWLSTGEYRPGLYVIIDLPESLFFSETFLRANFPELRFHYVQSPEPLGPSLSDHDVVFCPVQYHEAIRSYPFDLVENTGSLQEMTEEWVDYWMLWLEGCSCRYFYSLNYFAQPLNFLAEGHNTLSPRLPENWKVRYLYSDAALVKTQSPRSYADIIAERGVHSDFEERGLALARYNSTKEMFLNNQVLLEAMDALRINPEEGAMYHLLQRCLNDRQTVPKEAQYLCGYLMQHSSGEFKRNFGASLESIDKKLWDLRASGKEGIYLERPDIG